MDTNIRGSKMEYQLIRSRRKTVAICISRDGGVVVRAPMKTTKQTIEFFVAQKQDWIQEKSSLMAAHDTQRKNFSLTVGSELLLLGRSYPVVPGSNTAFDGVQFLVSGSNPEGLKSELIQVYQSIAKEDIPARVACFSERTGWVSAGVRIGSANTAWGSCSGKNKLNFTWKLIMAQPELIDYVVVHELAHTVEHNHSVRFWRLVERVLPDYQERRKQLRELARALQKQDWS